MMLTSDYGTYAQVGDMVKCLNPMGDVWGLGVLIAAMTRKSPQGQEWRLLHVLTDEGDVAEIKEAFVRLLEPRTVEHCE